MAISVLQPHNKNDVRMAGVQGNATYTRPNDNIPVDKKMAVI
jgi:hypothetical protein